MLIFRCGVLQVGDRVLAINDWCTANGSVQEAAHRVRHSNSPLTLTIEFDVIGWSLSAKSVA